MRAVASTKNWSTAYHPALKPVKTMIKQNPLAAMITAIKDASAKNPMF